MCYSVLIGTGKSLKISFFPVPFCFATNDYRFVSFELT
jgi:hypothetical protein